MQTGTQPEPSFAKDSAVFANLFISRDLLTLSPKMMSASASSDGYFHQRTFGHRHQQQQQQQQQRAGKMSPRTRVRAATTAAACGPLAGAASASRRPSLLRASSQPQPSCHIAAPYATRKALDWANDQATAVYKEMENLLELKYRGDIQDYMYHMEVRCLLITHRAHTPTSGKKG